MVLVRRAIIQLDIKYFYQKIEKSQGKPDVAEKLATTIDQAKKELEINHEYFAKI